MDAYDILFDVPDGEILSAPATPVDPVLPAAPAGPAPHEVTEEEDRLCRRWFRSETNTSICSDITSAARTAVLEGE